MEYDREGYPYNAGWWKYPDRKCAEDQLRVTLIRSGDSVIIKEVTVPFVAG